MNTNHTEEKVHMRSFVHEKAHWMPIDGHFYSEIMRCARLNTVAWHRIVMGVDKRFVQVQH